MGPLSRIRSVLTGDAVGSSLNTQPEKKEEVVDQSPTEGPVPTLFQCPSCKSVYIAIEMAQCSSCHMAVEQLQPARDTRAKAA